MPDLILAKNFTRMFSAYTNYPTTSMQIQLQKNKTVDNCTMKYFSKLQKFLGHVTHFSLLVQLQSVLHQKLFLQHSLRANRHPHFVHYQYSQLPMVAY